MKITLDIPDSEIEAARDTAGPAIAYWATEMWIQTPKSHTGKPIPVSGYVIEHNDSRDKSKHVRHELDIERGLRMMYLNYSNNSIRELSGSPALWDALQCDVFIQYAAFGEVRYG